MLLLRSHLDDDDDDDDAWQVSLVHRNAKYGCNWGPKLKRSPTLG